MNFATIFICFTVISWQYSVGFIIRPTRSALFFIYWMCVFPSSFPPSSLSVSPPRSLSIFSFFPYIDFVRSLLFLILLRLFQYNPHSTQWFMRHLAQVNWSSFVKKNETILLLCLLLSDYTFPKGMNKFYCQLFLLLVKRTWISHGLKVIRYDIEIRLFSIPLSKLIFIVNFGWQSKNSQGSMLRFSSKGLGFHELAQNDSTPLSFWSLFYWKCISVNGLKFLRIMIYNQQYKKKPIVWGRAESFAYDTEICIS